MTDELNALAERCEQAAGPDRELDAKIVIALDLRPDWVGDDGGLWIEVEPIYEPVIRLNTLGKRSVGNPPIGAYQKYTASLDAAMTLVPEGLRRLLDEQRAEWVVTLWADKFTPIAEARALTAALALCAAALKARAQVQP